MKDWEKQKDVDKAHIKANDNFNALLLRHLIYLGDFMSRVQIKYPVQAAIKSKRVKVYEQMRRNKNKN